MKLQSSLFCWGALIVLLVNSIPTGHQTVVADSDQPFCATKESDYDDTYDESCSPGEYCGINRLTGEIQGCVTADKCPNDGKYAKNETIVCSSTKPSCCCRTVLGPGGALGWSCNNILGDYDRKKQACSLPELINLPVCQRIWCRKEVHGTMDSENCGSRTFCGVEKNSGKLVACLEDSDCPANAKGSREIVCDKGSSRCCCQVYVPIAEQPVGPNCNNFIEDYTIWKQACGLKELRKLEECKEFRTTTTTTTTKKTTTTATTDQSEKSSFATEKATESQGEDLKENDTNETRVTTAAIVIGGIIVLLIFGGLVYVCLFKKPRQAAVTPWAYQQQQAYQQPIGSATGSGIYLSSGETFAKRTGSS